MRARAQAIIELGAESIGASRSIARAWAHAKETAGEALAASAFGDHVQQSQARQRIADWAKDYRTPTLVISGGNDSGKSVAATRWAGYVGGMWLRADDLERVSWSGGTIASLAVQARDLVIDDLGTDTHRAREHICSIICTRHDHNLRTLITTALAWGDSGAKKTGDDKKNRGTLLGEYPDSVISRIGAGWRPVTESVIGRKSAATPSLDQVRRAILIERAATRCEHAATTGQDMEAIDELIALLGLDPDAVAARTEEVERRWADEIGFLEQSLRELRAEGKA